MAKKHVETVRVRVIIANARAGRALDVAERCLESLLEDFGYREDVRRAAKAIRYARRHLGVETDDGSRMT